MSRVAAIDCGTNSVRLLVADLPVDGGPLVDVTRQLEIVRLGAGVDSTGRLSPEAMERTRVVLARYAREIQSLGAGPVRMVATSATRDAQNADEFRAMVTETLGVPPEVVTGAEEAMLSFVGAVRGLPPARYLVVDIGGGSTEFVLGDARTVREPAGAWATSPDGAPSGETGGRPATMPIVRQAGAGVVREASMIAAVSVDIGSVRLTERHLHGDPPTGLQVTAAGMDIRTEVDKALAAVSAAAADHPAPEGHHGPPRVVGVAGTVTTIAAIALDLTEYQTGCVHGAELSASEVAHITADLLGRSRRRRLEWPVMHPGRADVIAAGALILQAILGRVGVDSMIVSEHDILDGIAWSLA